MRLEVEQAQEQFDKEEAAKRRTGKKGKVTIAMNVAPNGDKGLEVSCDVSATAPKMAFGKSFFFKNDDGDLTREAPGFDLTDTGITTLKGGRDG